MGREGIKLVTRPDKKNSRGKEHGVEGIDLIAGNDVKDVQPLIKGDNLKELLLKVLDELSVVKARVDNLKTVVGINADTLRDHQHAVQVAPSGTGATMPGSNALSLIMSPVVSIETTVQSLESNFQSVKYAQLKSDYLKNPTSPKNICSKHNKTN